MDAEKTTRPGRPYFDVRELFADALDGSFFYAKGIEVDARFVLNSPAVEVISLLLAGDIRRSEVAE